MCGIFCYYNMFHVSPLIKKFIEPEFKKLKHRGPDNSKFEQINSHVIFGFHRLRVNDLGTDGDQPIKCKETYAICNGEIFNHEEIKNKYDLVTKTNSDCEIIPLLYNKLMEMNTLEKLDKSLETLCRELDGEFACIINDSERKLLTIFRDPYGVRPLFVGFENEKILFSSEMKAINNIVTSCNQFPPGICMVIDYNDFKTDFKYIHYNAPLSKNIMSLSLGVEFYLQNIKSIFTNAVKKRLMSERPVCALLSGGLDSSIVCSIAAKELAKNGKKLHTYSIGMLGSEDLNCARDVAQFIGSVHTSVVCSKEDFLNAIPDVIKVIESYDITTVRASIGNYLVCKHIAENSDAKVVLNGDYSDEVMGGYLYMKAAPNQFEFDLECKKLLKDIIFFDSLRSDRTISANGLEGRVPFADKHFVEFYNNIPIELRHKPTKIEKYLFRDAFNDGTYLPDHILYRKKEAFSDGVSRVEDSWHNILDKWIDERISDEEFENYNCWYNFNKPMTKEALLYRNIFESIYSHTNVIPYFWMPNKNWIKTSDPSARTLKELY
jgi:asparagine synthase (glutamine-hydrolysing)